MKDQCYEFIKNQTGKPSIVGFGSYGQVKIAKNLSTNQIVAIKLIHGKNAKQQIDVHHKLNHSNIIKLINYYYEKEKHITYMVLQYAQGGSLNDKIKFGYGLLSKQLVLKYFKDICEAIKYLHHNNYMHRDIKPENILIAKNNTAKLCDFGFAAILQFRSTMCGTFEYMAPQMIKKRPYDYKIDIWALGILLFQLIQGVAPFKGQTGQQVITEMKKPIKFSNRFTSVEIDLIKKILRVNAQNRPTIDEILQHPYFKDFKQQQKKEILNNNNKQLNSTLFKQNSRDNLLQKKNKEQGFTNSKEQILKFPNSNLDKEESKIIGAKKNLTKEVNTKKQIQDIQTPQFNFDPHQSFSQISTITMNSFIQSQNKNHQQQQPRQMQLKRKQSTPVSPTLNSNFQRFSPTKLNNQEQNKRQNFQPSFLSNKKMTFYNPINDSNQNYNNTDPKNVVQSSSFVNNNKKISLTQKLNYQKHNSSYSIPTSYSYKSNGNGIDSNLNSTLNSYNTNSNNNLQKNRTILSREQQNKNQKPIKYSTTINVPGSDSANILKYQFQKQQFQKDNNKEPIKDFGKYQKPSNVSYVIGNNNSKFSNNNYIHSSIKTQPSMSNSESTSYTYTKKLFTQKLQPQSTMNKISQPLTSAPSPYSGYQFPTTQNNRRQYKPTIVAKKE